MTSRLRRADSSLLLALVLYGCGTESDRASEVHTTRVLAVRAESPFIRPGAATELSMLAYDGSPRARRADGSMRPTSTLWIGGCINPPGDNYAACVPYLHAVVDQLSDENLAQQTIPADAPAGVVGWGSVFQAQTTADIISSRPVAKDVVYPYGVEIVFFAYCGGTLRRVNSGQHDFPLGCFDRDSGEQLGRDDFEFGFYPLFSYESIENQNPILNSMNLAGASAGGDCSDLSPCSAGYYCGSEQRCLPIVQRCTASNADDCEKHTIVVDVPRTSVEPAVVAHITAADAKSETIWVSYYASGGSFEHEAQLINDSNTGWNDNSAGVWRANTEANREVRLWAVVRDNRNGLAWSSVDVWVQ